jgi:hypothetical protein
MVIKDFGLFFAIIQYSTDVPPGIIAYVEEASTGLAGD